MNRHLGSLVALATLLLFAGFSLAQETVTPEQMKQALEQMQQLGQGGGEPTDYNEYRKSAPKTLLKLPLVDSSGQNQKVMNMASSSLTLEYGEGDKQIEVSFNDTGTMAGVAMARMAFSLQVEVENDDGFTKSTKIADNNVIHIWEKDSGRSRAALGLGERGMLEVKATGLGANAALDATRELPLSDWAEKASK